MARKRIRSYEDLLEDWRGLLDEAKGKDRLRRGKKRLDAGPSPRTRSARLEAWQHLLAALRENEPDLPYLETHRSELETLLRQAEELLQVQAALTGLKQGATKQLSSLFADCQRLATVLKLTVKQCYGPSADKLEDFGIQPARPRKLARPAR